MAAPHLSLDESLLESADSRRSLIGSTGCKLSVLFISLGIFVTLYNWDGQHFIVQPGPAVAMAMNAIFMRRAVPPKMPMREHVFQQQVLGASQVQRIQQQEVRPSQVLHPMKLRRDSVIARQEGLGGAGGDSEKVDVGGIGAPVSQDQLFQEIEETGNAVTDCAAFYSQGIVYGAEQQTILPRNLGTGMEGWEEEEAEDKPENYGLTTSMRAYGKNSVINVFNWQTGLLQRIEGFQEIQEYYADFIENLYGTPIVYPIVEREEGEMLPATVYCCWKAGLAGYTVGVTFSLDQDAHIIEENVFLTRYRDPDRFFLEPEEEYNELAEEVWPTGSGIVHDTWQNHWDAFGELDVDKMMQDYTEFSEITIFKLNGWGNKEKNYKGLGQIRECLEEVIVPMFSEGFDDFSAPIQLVQESEAGRPGNVMTVWSSEANGFEKASESFFFSPEGKIMRHTFSYFVTEDRLPTRPEDAFTEKWGNNPTTNEEPDEKDPNAGQGDEPEEDEGLTDRMPI